MCTSVNEVKVPDKMHFCFYRVWNVGITSVRSVLIGKLMP